MLFRRKEINVVPFFYDNEYINPNPPRLLDLNGDGVFELVLSGTGHNSYARVYAWQNDAFESTDVAYYSGD